MMNFKKWVSCQLVSKSLLSARPFSFFDEDSPDGQTMNQSTVDRTNMGESGSVDNNNSSDNQVSESPAGPLVVTTLTSDIAQQNSEDKDQDPLKKVEALQIKFLRLVHRIGESPDDIVVAQVLYRLQLATLIRTGESEVKRPSLKTNKARAIAAEQEATSRPNLDFSFKILLLGKTGVGKSATINSIFDQPKVVTDAFQPATKSIQEIVGTIKGMKVTVIDTPGLLPSCRNQRQNRVLMHKVRRFIRKSPPDIVLYFERLDLINKGYNDYPLLKLITDVFGSSIWFNTILVMTHSSAPPEGPDGYPVNYESFVHHRTNILQHYIRQAVSNTQLENPVVLVENHPMCRTNTKGEKVLPNGHIWMSKFFLLCTATKVLGEANSLLKFQDSLQLTPAGTRLPSLPHLLSSLLRTHSFSSSGGIDNELGEISDNDEDEYDQLPPIRILTKAQYQKLSKAQRNAYLDELDYRETLYLKKQLKEEVRRRKLAILQSDDASFVNDDFESSSPQEAMQVTDIAIPQSFDSDCPVYRYRCQLGNDQWLWRPVLDPQGWDHDVGFDGISLEASQNIKRNIYTSIAGQMSKDKDDFSIRSECAARYTGPNDQSFLGGVDIQTSGRDLVCTAHGDAKFRNMSWNTTGGGFSVTKYGNLYFVGAKLEDSIAVGRRFKLTMNTGRMGGCGQVAYGGSLEAIIKGKDYPARDEKVSFAATMLSFDKDTVLGGSIQSDFRVGHGSTVSISANLNSRKLGQVCVRTSTSDHVEIALVAVISLIQALFRRKSMDVVE
ncbi:translocase of chloroplast 90, chloroplastic [Typha latifolia]|uniref:translocase of chloroplast 90, chloroplastic n=1 Tax=Typha latifolia TaxID=4733 RepID=UPI003C2C9579